MSIVELGALGEFLAAFGVFVTLVYLAVQLRQTQKVVMAQAFQARSDALQDLSMRLAESEDLSRIQLKLREDADLSDLEKQRWRNHLLAHLHRMSNLAVQHDDGMLTREYYELGIRGTIVFWKKQWDAFGIQLPPNSPLIRVYEDATSADHAGQRPADDPGGA
jgi:hypothetical protein